MKIKSLPPLNSLVAFEAAARHLSFTRAADEICVTQGAVSRQIRLLEEFLGARLFVRDTRNLRMTSMGAQYYETVRNSLHEISQSTNEILQHTRDEQITVITSYAMASFWLLPRYNVFQDEYPDVDLRIVSVNSFNDVSHFEYDLALFFRAIPPKDLEVTPLFGEKAFPVCSPKYLERNPELTGPKNLAQATLLTLEDNEDWVRWRDWFEESGLEMPANIRRIKMNNYPLLIQAALNGQGFALGWERLVDDYLESGLLIRPIAFEVSTTSQFYLMQPKTVQRQKLGAEQFCTWLEAHVDASD